MTYSVLHIDEAERIPGHGFSWRPLRKVLGTTAFGINGYTAGPGDEVIEDHDETSAGSAGHEELYVVVSGAATFTVDGDEIQAPAGTLLSVPPGTRRGATATEPGTTVLVIGGARSLRATVLPLWADHVGISAEATSLVFGVAAFVEILLFYPAGWTMDRFGRTVVAVPVVVLIGAGVALLPLADGLVLFTVLAVVMAVGNGMGSGIVMTLGADTAPAAGRAQYLGGWRLAGDVGTTSGPLTVTVLTAVWPLAAACVVTGLLCLAGSLWVWRRVAASEETRRARLRDAGSGAGPGS